MLLTNSYYSDSATEREPPRPKPRQRTLGLSLHATEKIAEDAESQDVSRPQTSSTSIPISTGTSSNIAVRSCSPYTSHCLVIQYFKLQSKKKHPLIGAYVHHVVSPCSGQKVTTQFRVASADPPQTRVSSRRSSPSLRLILDQEVLTDMYSTTTTMFYCFVFLTH